MEISLSYLINFNTRISFCLVIACLSFLPAAAQTAPADWKQQDLLAGRLSIRTPPDAKAQGPALSSIMGTAPSAASKTRIRVPVSGTEIVVQAKSLNALAPKDMAAAIKSTEYYAKYDGEKQELTLDLGGGWSALAIIPKQYKYWDDSYCSPMHGSGARMRRSMSWCWRHGPTRTLTQSCRKLRPIWSGACRAAMRPGKFRPGQQFSTARARSARGRRWWSISAANTSSRPKPASTLS